MKITKAKLKQIIKEELSLQEIFGSDEEVPNSPSDRGMGKKVSRMITALEQIGAEVERVHKSTRDPDTIQQMEMIDGLITKLHDEMSDLL